MAKRFHKTIIKMRRDRKKTPDEKSARLNFLIRWADVKVENERTPQEQRAAFNRMRRPKKLKQAQCWVCRNVALLVRHHIIQIQHGGGNWDLNLVNICERCHCEIHPWLPPPENYKVIPF